MAKRKKKLNLKNLNTIEGKKNDKIRVTDFRVNPLKPSEGDSVTVNMAIKNVSSKALKSVPWQIGVDKKILHSGTGYNVPAGNSFKVCISWTASKGQHFIYGDADPDNILREPKIKQFNNLPQGIDIKVK